MEIKSNGNVRVRSVTDRFNPMNPYVTRIEIYASEAIGSHDGQFVNITTTIPMSPYIARTIIKELLTEFRKWRKSVRDYERERNAQP